MSYERSPRPSLVMTVGTRFIALTPCIEADSGFRFGWRVGHREVSAEVGDAAQRLQWKRRRGQPELDRRVLRPRSLLRICAQQPREICVDVGRSGPERVCNREKPLRGDLLAAALHLRKVRGREPG